MSMQWLLDMLGQMYPFELPCNCGNASDNGVALMMFHHGGVSTIVFCEQCARRESAESLLRICTRMMSASRPTGVYYYYDVLGRIMPMQRADLQ